MKGVHIIVSGRVQGVGFRYATAQAAARHGLTGWVKNLPSGDVEIYAEGEDSGIEPFVKWAGQGPPGARVSNVKKQYKAYTGYFSRFSIEH